MLYPDVSSPLTFADFEARMSAAEFEMPMGPRGNIQAEEAAPEPETLTAFWDFLADGANSLDVHAAVQRLQEMSLDANREGAIGEGPDSLDWKSFAKGLGAPPFEKW